MALVEGQRDEAVGFGQKAHIQGPLTYVWPRFVEAKDASDGGQGRCFW